MKGSVVTRPRSARTNKEAGHDHNYDEGRQRDGHLCRHISELIQALDLKNTVLIGFSAGGGEVARQIGRHSPKRVARAALIFTVPPLMLKTAANPAGLPIELSA